MTNPVLKRAIAAFLIIGLASIASAARAPKDSQDLINRLDSLWGKSAADFPKAAGLKAGEYQTTDSPAGAGKKIALAPETGGLRWTPKSLATAVQTFAFDPKLGLVAVSGPLKGAPADFDALLKELNTRYGQYSLHNNAGDLHTYGWVFPKATLSVTSNEGAPALLRIQANP